MTRPLPRRCFGRGASLAWPTLTFAFVAFVTFAAGTVACSKRSGPLPGDSVSEDGAVALSPAKLDTSPRDSRDSRDPREPLGAVESRLYPPELVMDHQGELGIDPKQRDALLREIEKGQSEMVRLQWDLQGEKEKLVKVLDGEKVDEQASLAAAARVMERENKVKSSHLAMLVRVKNLLTGAQQAKLKVLREGERAGAQWLDSGAPQDSGKRD